MKTTRLQNRFLLAGSLLVIATIVSGVWSGLTFRRMNVVIDATLQTSQEIVDLSAELHSSLEREDDALLLFLSGNVEQARQNLAAERKRADASYKKLLERLENNKSEEQQLAANLKTEIDRYRSAGDELLADPDSNEGLERYHRKINPLLRQAVAACESLREANFRSMRQAGIEARDQAARGTQLVSAISILTVLLGIGVAVWLARSILSPVKELTRSVDEIRQGNYEHRVQHVGADELGQLAAGFNRMADAISDYRRSSLGDLLTAKTTLESTLNALPDAVFVFAPDESIAAINPPAQKILNANQVVRVERLDDLPISGEHRQIVRAALSGKDTPERAFDFARTLNFELDGRWRRFTLTAVSIPGFEQGRCGAAVVLDDVTEFARLDEVRSELIGVASHELNSPLTSLRMSLLMLAEEAPELPTRLQQLLDAAVEGCHELGLTIDELLDVTRVEAGQLRLNLAPVDLKQVLVGVLKNMHSRFDDANMVVSIHNDSESSENTQVLGDQIRLARVLANLLENALKYSSLGDKITVEFSKGYKNQTGELPSVQVVVADLGIGVPVEYREQIFEKFFRVEHQMDSNQKRVRGTGIGLYLCREIIQAHGGTIHCESGDNGIGTKFVIRLPA